MKILVLGGCGLLGSHLFPELENSGHEVGAVDNFKGSFYHRRPSKKNIYVADATNLNALTHSFTKFKPEVIIIAAASYFAPDLTYNFHDDCSNTFNTVNNVCSLITEETKGVYFCSSSEVYGSPKSRSAWREDKRIDISSTLKGATELAAESLLKMRCESLGIPNASFRIFDMYGPRYRYTPRSGVISFLIDSFIREEVIGLSGSKIKRDFIHVSDVASAMVKLIDVGAEGVYNIGTGEHTDLISIVKGLKKHMEVKHLPVDLGNAGAKINSVADITKLKSIIKWKPKISLAKSMPKLIEFRKEQHDLDTRKDPKAFYDMMKGT